jgi:hypothetical protein
LAPQWAFKPKEVIMATDQSTLQELLHMQIDGINQVTGETIKYSPDFLISVQEIRPDGIVKIIVHPDGYSGETLDFLVDGNICYQV